MEKIMPDLFVVMSDDELMEAIQYARDEGASHATSIIAINYDITINGEDIESYSEKTGKWFPDFVEYVNLKTANNDEIGILLSPTVWNTFDESLVYKTLREKGISCDIFYDPLFINPKKLMNYIECEKIISSGLPINSPWTARDFSVVEASLESILNIKKATILQNANFEISLYVRDFDDTTSEFVIASEVAKKKVVERFFYPHVLHLETDNGIFNVYMGKDIDINEVLSILEEKGIDTIIKNYESDDKELLLYESRTEKIEELKLS